MSRTDSRQRTTQSAAETRAMGRALGELLVPGHAVALIGDLGAGKTELVRGIASGAGVNPRDVSSPTFAIVAEYPGRVLLHHADLYRMEDADDLYATGFFDLPIADSILLVEWADRVPGALPPEHLRITLEWMGDDARRLEAVAFGDRHVSLLQAWL